MITRIRLFDLHFGASVGRSLCQLGGIRPHDHRSALLLFAAATCSMLASVARAQAPEPLPLPAVGTAVLPRDLSPWGMFLSSDIVVKAVIVGLVVASIATWTVCLAKAIELVLAKRHARAAVVALASAASLADITQSGPRNLAKHLCAVAVTEFRLSTDAFEKDGLKERIASRLERVEAAFSRRISRGTGVLATIGATAPFVGLFGTVWGIMNSFIGISKSHTTNLAIVAPGIAEALLATAFGLAAAIPAVVIYNLFARSIASYRALLGDASAEMLRLVSRDLDRGAAARRQIPDAAE
jgi:biopolymer transport protein ExbB